jgi:hypothetical protein
MSTRELQSWYEAEWENMRAGRSGYLAILHQCRRDVERAVSQARVWGRIFRQLELGR